MSMASVSDQWPVVRATRKHVSLIDAPTRIRRAIYLNDLTLLKRVIKNNPQLVQNADLSDHGNTSLHLAAKLGFTNIADFLISAGHEKKGISRNAKSQTPLHLAVAHAAESEAGAAVVHLIALRFPRCIPLKNDEGLDAIMLAARTSLKASSTDTSISSQPELIPDLINLHPWPLPISLEATDLAGNTALHHATAWGNLKAIRTLLELGADPAARNERSWTPVAYSASVQADVYFRNLVSGPNKEAVVGRNGEVLSTANSAAAAGAGGGGGSSNGGNMGSNVVVGGQGRDRGGSGTARSARSASGGESSGVGQASPNSRARGGSGGKVGVRMVRAESVGNEGVQSIEGLPKPEGRLRNAMIEAGLQSDR